MFLCHPHLKKYIDNAHSIIGNLKIINNFQFNKLMKNDIKYRLPSDISVNSIMKELTYDLDLFIYKISVSYNKHVAFLIQWKCMVINKFLIVFTNNLSHYCI